MMGSASSVSLLLLPPLHLAPIVQLHLELARSPRLPLLFLLRRALLPLDEF
jgi:hypothetical protein